MHGAPWRGDLRGRRLVIIAISHLKQDSRCQPMPGNGWPAGNKGGGEEKGDN